MTELFSSRRSDVDLVGEVLDELDIGNEVVRNRQLGQHVDAKDLWEEREA